MQVARHARGALSRSLPALSYGLQMARNPYVRAAASAIPYVARRAFPYAARALSNRFKTKYQKQKTDDYRTFEDISDNNKAIDTTFDSIVLGSPKSISSLGRWTYLYQNQGSVVIAPGTQGVTDMAFHGHITSQYLSTSTATGIVPIYEWRNSPFDINPSQRNTGGNVISQQNSPVNDLIYLDSCDCDMQIVNSSNTPIICDVYFMEPKRGVTDGPTTMWSRSLSDVAMGQGTAFNPGSISGTVVSGYPAADIYGVEPYHEPSFMKQWKIQKKRTITLQGGSTHKEKYTVSFNKFLRKDILQQKKDQGITLDKGISLVLMLVARPGPVVIREGTNVKSSDVGYSSSSGKVGWIYTHRYKYKGIGSARFNVNRAAPQFIEADTSGGTKFEAIIDSEDSVINVEQA